MKISWEDFILMEKTSKDSIDLKRIYVDMAGDLEAGVLLSQLVFYYLPTDRKSRLWTKRAGKWWIALQRKVCWRECRLTPEQYDRSVDILAGKYAEKIDKRRKDFPIHFPTKPLIDVELHIGKSGAPCPHLRLLRDNFLSCFAEEAEKAKAIESESEGEPVFYPEDDEESILAKLSNASGNGDSAGQAFEGNAEKHLREMPKSDLGNTPKSHLGKLPKSIYKKQEVKKVVEDIYTSDVSTSKPAKQPLAPKKHREPDAATAAALERLAETESVIAPYREAFLGAYGVLAGDMPKKDLAEMAEPVLTFLSFASKPGPQDLAACTCYYKALWKSQDFVLNNALSALRLVVKGYASWASERPGPDAVKQRQAGRPGRPQGTRVVPDRRAGDARHYGGTPEDRERIKANIDPHEWDWLKTENQAQGVGT